MQYLRLLSMCLLSVLLVSPCCHTVYGLSVIINTTIVHTWSQASSGWSGVGTRNPNSVAIFLASNATKLTVFPNGTVQEDSSVNYSYSATAVSPSSGLMYFVGGNAPISSSQPLISSFYANGTACGLSAPLPSATRYPAVAAIGVLPFPLLCLQFFLPLLLSKLYLAGGTTPGFIVPLPPSSSQPCAPDTTIASCASTTPFASGFFSVGVSTGSSVLFTAGCNADLALNTLAGYGYSCSRAGTSDVLLYRPTDSAPCPVLSGAAANAIAFNITSSRRRVGAAASTQHVVFAGGEIQGGNISNILDIYNVSAIDSATIQSAVPPVVWESRLLSVARRSPRVVVVSDRFFFILGGDSTAGASNSYDVWDSYDDSLVSGTLVYGAALVAAAEDPTMVDSVLYVGGYNPLSSTANMYRLTAVGTAMPQTTTPASTTSSSPPASTTASSMPTTSATVATTSSTTTTTQPATTTATTSPPVPGGCFLPSPPGISSCVNGTWIVLGNVSVSADLNVTSPIVINGALEITNMIETVVRIHPLAGQQVVPITVKEDASVGGVIELHITSLTPTTVPILMARSISGKFSGVRVISDDQKGCKKGTLQTSGTQVSVLISDCKKSLRWWIYLIAVVAALLLVLVVIVLGFVAKRKGWLKNAYRSRVKTSSSQYSRTSPLLQDHAHL